MNTFSPNSLRLVHLVDTVAVHVVLPSMEDTSKAALLVASQPKGSSPCGDRTRPTARCARWYPGRLSTPRPAVSRGQGVPSGSATSQSIERRQPVPPQRVTHGCTRPSPGYQFILFHRQHETPPLDGMNMGESVQAPTVAGMIPRPFKQQTPSVIARLCLGKSGLDVGCHGIDIATHCVSQVTREVDTHHSGLLNHHEVEVLSALNPPTKSPRRDLPQREEPGCRFQGQTHPLACETGL